MTIVEFIEQMIAEDEAVALDSFYEGQTWSTEEEVVVSIDQDLEPVLFMDRKRDATHAARWSPARVLRECAAKRAIVEMGAERMALMPEFMSQADIGARGQIISTLRALASAYADHEDFDAGWLG